MGSTGFDWRALLANPATTIDALVAVAADPAADVEALAALAGDVALLRRAPAVVRALYRNPRASMTVANRAIVTARQGGVTCDDFPELAELATVVEADPTALDPAFADAGFAAALQTSLQAPGTEGDETEAESAATAPKGQRKSAIIDFTKLKLYEKIRMATLGNAYCRLNLLRDSNRMVALAVIRSPQITDGEIVKAAGNRALSEDVIRYIANRKEMVKQYAVKVALVSNAKCPLGIALRLLPSLHGDDIKQLARSKNVPGALSVAAKRLAAAREPQ